jgi:ATP-dependent DNA helicase RecG
MAVMPDKWRIKVDSMCNIDIWRRGTLKIIKSCKEAGLPEPEIKEMNGGIEVSVFNLLQSKNSVKFT